VLLLGNFPVVLPKNDPEKFVFLNYARLAFFNESVLFSLMLLVLNYFLSEYPITSCFIKESGNTPSWNDEKYWFLPGGSPLLKLSINRFLGGYLKKKTECIRPICLEVCVLLCTGWVFYNAMRTD